MQRFSFGVLALSLALFALGCSSSTPSGDTGTTGTNTTTAVDDHSHDEAGHSHDEAAPAEAAPAEGASDEFGAAPSEPEISLDPSVDGAAAEQPESNE